MTSSMPERSDRGSPSASAEEAKLGTFLGVFTPSILTILGVILFLRTGWVVGSVGLLPALAIVVVANSITLATALSVSAIATNMHVGAGGAYYIISRSLGLEFGGAIGVPLFLAQAFSVTLYAFGLAESLRLFWPGLPMRTIAGVTVVLVAIVAGKSAEFALRLQIPVMVAIGIALFSLLLGVAGRAGESLQLVAAAEEAVPLWVVFAVFFPAVTGLMAGVSLSGDLRDPKRAIPWGTIAAVLTGFAVYLVVPVALAIAADPQDLVSDSLIWFSIAAVPLLVLPGLLGAILSSAVGSMLGAPRTLEALSVDRIVPHLLTLRPFGARGPSIAYLGSAGLALAAVLLGGLNAVAPVLTMFFLTTYGMINLVAGLEQLSGAPSYRPTIKVWWGISLAGALGCFWVMSLINWFAAAVAVVVEIALYVVLRRRSLSASWGDMRYGTMMSLVRGILLRIRHLPVAPRNWRPHILVFAGDLEQRLDLVRFAAWLNQDRGLLSVCWLLVGEIEEIAPKLDTYREEMQRRLDDEGLIAFSEVHAIQNLESGALAVAQAHGIAGLVSNCVMFGWGGKPDRVVSVLRVMRGASLLGKSTVICRIAPRSWAPRTRRIDVWWGGLESNGDMLLLFAHLLSMNSEWSSARISVKCVSSAKYPSRWSESRLADLLLRSRIDAAPQVIDNPEDRSIKDIIQESSKDADIVFLGLREPPLGDEPKYAARLADLIGDLPTVVMVRAAGLFAGHLLDTPESETDRVFGEGGTLAALGDSAAG
jgi:solute carrier family 12 (potassium/chloride transporter), member 4/6